MNKKDMDLGSGRASKKRSGPKDMDLGSGRASKKRSGPKDMDLGSGIRPSKKEFNLKKDMDLGSGTRKAKPTNLKKSNGNKPKVVTPKMIKDAGFTTLRDYLNDKRGLTRKDGKKVVKTSTKSSAPKAPPAAPNRGKKKIVSSLKSSRSGIDGGASQVNKAKKKKSNFFDSIGSGIKKAVKETKRNFSGDIKKGTGRYKSLSTGKTNFNKKKKKLAKQISV